MEEIDLRDLLIQFNKKGYSDSSVKYIDNKKQGKLLRLNIGDYVYEDEFYGGEPYSGNETIWKSGMPIFRCVYYGAVLSDLDIDHLYAFLKNALALGPDKSGVHRGPKLFSDKEWKYINVCSGDIDAFEHVEKIFYSEKLVYKATFIGGLINIK